LLSNSNRPPGAAQACPPPAPCIDDKKNRRFEAPQDSPPLAAIAASVRTFKAAPILERWAGHKKRNLPLAMVGLGIRRIPLEHRDDLDFTTKATPVIATNVVTNGVYHSIAAVICPFFRAT
jgi:hypothetical protein